LVLSKLQRISCVYYLTLVARDSKYKRVAGAVILERAQAAYTSEGLAMVICPECESDLDIEEDEVDEGEVVSCPECGTDFEVVTVEPLELSRVEEAGVDDEEEVADEAEEE
jgi:alpha-aminoadipate carrier protein LysW